MMSFPKKNDKLQTKNCKFDSVLSSFEFTFSKLNSPRWKISNKLKTETNLYFIVCDCLHKLGFFLKFQQKNGKVLKKIYSHCR